MRAPFPARLVLVRPLFCQIDDDHNWPAGRRLTPRTELRARLTEPPLAIWSSGDVLHVLWQGQADEVQLYGGVQPRLWPVEGTGDLWEVSLRIRRLDQAVISVMVASRDRAGPRTARWRSPSRTRT